MKTRSIKPIVEFLRKAEPGIWYIDTQYAEIHYASRDVTAIISTRIDAAGDVYIIELEETDMANQETQTGITLPEELLGKKFRIRKLTPRECFRLMGVDDSDIDKMQQAGISNSGQYKLAGNSIVVDVLYHIFRRMFIDTEEPDFDGNPTQLTLF